MAMTRRWLWSLGLVFFACGNGPTPPRHAEPRLRKLLAAQYTNSVRSLLGSTAAELATPPPDIATQGYESIGASEISLSDVALAQYEASASAIAESVVSDVSQLPALMGCAPSGPADRDCFDTFVRGFGRRAFRRPLTEDEVTRYVDLAIVTAGRYQNAFAGVSYTISAFLQSPNFLYQVEVGEVDPDESSRRRLTGYEMATRMSFFLLDTTPDDALLDAAATGLKTRETILAQATELVGREDARGALDHFFEERYKLRDLTSLTKDPALFPLYSVALAEAMHTESLMLLRDVVWDRDADVRELLDADYAFVNRDLATLYNLAPVAGTGFEKRTLTDGRRGVFGQASFLARQAHPTSTSPTRRGRFISERLLCIDIPPPPPEIVTELPPPVPNMPMTMRQRLAQHSGFEQCASCHVRMDGIGLALENFDAIGKFRTTDEGLPIDPSGEIVDVGTFQGLSGMTALTRDMPELSRCWVRSLYRHATGHLEAEGDELALEQVDTAFVASEYRLKSLLIEIVASDAFRFVDNKGSN